MTSTALGATATAGDLVDGTTLITGGVLSITATAGHAAFSLTLTATTSLADLNTALAASNLSATLDSTNKLVFSTTNDTASSTIGTVAVTTGTATFGAATTPVADAASQTIRAGLVKQYNDIITQITTTSQDASFNGINLLNGDDLKLTFNETGKSTLNVKGVTFNAVGLGLASLTSGTDFLDNSSANAALTKLSAASSLLRTEASALGSNLSVVQICQDFNKNLINVLQTGSSNLTLADTNEEAANSQALSTVSRSPCPRWRWPTRASRASFSSSADINDIARTRRRGNPPLFVFGSRGGKVSRKRQWGSFQVTKY